MGTIQQELAKAGLVNPRKASLWEQINALKPEFRRVSKEKAEAGQVRADSATMARIEFRLQSVLKQIKRLTKIEKAIR
jgi:hypothetical protein